MPQLLRLRFCNVGPHRARMEDLTLPLADIVTGQAAHSAIWLRNGGGKTTLLSLSLWLLCPDKSMPDKNQIDDYVQSDDRSVLIAEWQMDKKEKQLSLWSEKPERYLTGVFCEWHATASSQEGKKLRHFFFAARVIENEPRLSLEDLPIYGTRQGQRERRSLSSFRQEWRELDHLYPQAEVESTEVLIEWRSILERIGVDPELFRYQIRMNTREGGAAEPFMFQENDQFVNFFLEFMGEAATGNEIAETIKTFRQTLLFLHQQLDPEYRLLQVLIPHYLSLCGVAGERERLYHQIRSVQNDIREVILAVTEWLQKQAQERSEWERIGKAAQGEAQRLRDDARQRRRRALLLRYAAAQKCVQQLQTEKEQLQAHVDDTKQHAMIWQAALPFRTVIRSRKSINALQAQINALQHEHRPLLDDLQESAYRYVAALSAKREDLRAEEHRLTGLAEEHHREAIKLRKQAEAQKIDATKYDHQAKGITHELATFHHLHKKLEDQGCMQPEESWVHAQERLQHHYAQLQKDHTFLQEAIETLTEDQQACEDNLKSLKNKLFEMATRIQSERDRGKPAQEARQQIANDQVLKQYLEVTELDFDTLTPQALRILQKKQQAWEEQIALFRLTLAEQDAMIQYLSDYGFLPPAQAVAQVLEVLKKEHLTAWSGWHYLTTNIRETERRIWLQRLPELAFSVVVPDEDWVQIQQTLQTTQPYLETPVVIFAQQDMQEDVLVHGWAIGPTSDAYFNRDAASHELVDREQRRHQVQGDLDELSRNTQELKVSIKRLEHTLEHYPTAWWHQHLTTLAEANEQHKSEQAQQKPREQELYHCTIQVQKRTKDLGEIKTLIQNLEKNLTRLQDHEAQLTIDPLALQTRETQQHVFAEACRAEAQQFETQAEAKDDEEKETKEKEKQLAENAKGVEYERNEVRHLVGDPPIPHPGDLPTLRALYQSLFAQYHQKIGAGELTVLYEHALNEEKQAYQQFQKKLQKPVQEKDVQDVLDPLIDLDDADQYAQDAITAKVHAENERKNQQNTLFQAEKDKQESRQRLMAQNIDEHELEGTLPESEELCTKEAVEEERAAGNSEQTAQQKKTEEQEATQNVQRCKTRIESLDRVQNQVSIIQESYASLLKVASITRPTPDNAEQDASLPTQEKQTALQEEEIDHSLLEIQRQLKRMQEEKEDLDLRGRRSAQEIKRALNEINREFQEVSLAKRLLEHEEEVYEQQCQHFLTELYSRQKWVEKEREKILVHKDTLVQQLLALADAGAAFLNSASKYSRLPATLPAFEQRPFLRMNLTMPATREEQRGTMADLLDAIVKEGKIPSGLGLLQQAVHRLANPIAVQILFPDPHTLHYVPPTRMMKESGGERLTSMVLLYCTLLRMRAAYRTKAAGKSSCLILDNPLGVASRALFLELQREVAQAMGIQLIYTTAIKDFDALHVFPNVIRLRNDQRDRHTGDHLLMLDTTSAGLEVMRIMHSESRDFSQERQNRQS